MRKGLVLDDDVKLFLDQNVDFAICWLFNNHNSATGSEVLDCVRNRDILYIWLQAGLSCYYKVGYGVGQG